MTDEPLLPELRPVRGSVYAGLAAALAAFAFLLYLPTVQFDFIRYDDPHYVWLHPRVSQGLTWENLRWAMTAFEVGNWHPLTLISHMADVSLFGMRPGAHHLVNALLHAANVALLFALFAAGTRRPLAAAAAAAIFAIHPLNVESVVWISQRKSVLAIFFLLLAMLAHLSWTRRRGTIRYLAALAAFAAALAAKPMVVVAPALLLLLDVWPLGRFEGGTFRERARCVGLLVLEKLPFLGFAAASSIVTVIAQHDGGAIGSLENYPPATRLVNALFAYAWYPFRTVWPTDLSLFYPTTLGSEAAWRIAGAAALLVALGLLAAVASRRAPYVPFGVAWYALGLLPVAGLVQFGTQIVADRYAYLPLIGLFVAIAYAGADLFARSSVRLRQLALPVGAAVAIALVFAQQGALAPWRNSVSILERGVSRAPGNAHALTNLGLLYVTQERFDEGIALLKRAEAIVPLFRPIQVNLGYAYARQGRLEEARAHYEEALRLRADDPGVVLELGRVLASLGENAAAEARLREAITLDPASARAHLLLGTLLHAQERDGEALPIVERAVALQPADAKARTALGLVLEAHGLRDEALDSLREAVRLDPEFERAKKELDRIEEGAAPKAADPADGSGRRPGATL